jgi:hypothetical protein
MERVAREADDGHSRVGNFAAFGIFVFVQLGAHCKTGVGCRGGNQLDDCAIASQGLAAPDGDERKQAMLDLVPLAGARRHVGDGRCSMPWRGRGLDRVE